MSLESVKKVYDMIGWDLEYSFTRDDMVTLLDALCGYESGNEQMADDIADLATKLTDRAASLVFPLLSPAELSNEEVQLEAQHCLSLIDLEEHVKLQTYIDHQRHQYF